MWQILKKPHGAVFKDMEGQTWCIYIFGGLEKNFQILGIKEEFWPILVQES